MILEHSCREPEVVVKCCVRNFNNLFTVKWFQDMGVKASACTLKLRLCLRLLQPLAHYTWVYASLCNDPQCRPVMVCRSIQYCFVKCYCCLVFISLFYCIFRNINLTKQYWIGYIFYNLSCSSSTFHINLCIEHLIIIIIICIIHWLINILSLLYLWIWEWNYWPMIQSQTACTHCTQFHVIRYVAWLLCINSKAPVFG